MTRINRHQLKDCRTGLPVCPYCRGGLSPSPEVRFYTLEEMESERGQMGPHEEEVGLLFSAASILLNGGDEAERACWRVADALFLLWKKFPSAAGIGQRTGRGGKLSIPRHPKWRTQP